MTENETLILKKLDMIQSEVEEMTDKITKAVQMQATTFENFRRDLTGDEGILQRLIPEKEKTSLYTLLSGQIPLLLLCFLVGFMIIRDSSMRGSITTPAGSAILEHEK